MFTCLGLSIFGVCAYNPGDPPHIYFSVGEAIAALSITLAIPQFVKPIYLFRLKTQAIRLPHLYSIVLAGALFTLIAAVMPNIEMNRRSIMSYPLFWELLGGLCFFSAFGALAHAFLRPSNIQRAKHRHFTVAVANFLAHAEERDRADFSKDLLNNIEKIIEAASFLNYYRNNSAFYDFRFRTKIEAAKSAAVLLQLVSEPAFCATLVHRCPWDTAAILQVVSEKKLYAQAAQNFIREVARQAVISPTSMMAREISYRGFRAAALLTRWLFSDRFIRQHYAPLRGLEFEDFRNVDAKMIKRFNHAVISSLKMVFSSQEYWQDDDILRISEHYGWATRDAVRRSTENPEQYEAMLEVSRGLRDIVSTTEDHLDGVDGRTKSLLYAGKDERRDFTTLDCVAEAVLEVLNGVANDFRGFEDPSWLMVIDLFNKLFPCIGEQPSGMNPLQQRVAIKLIDEVKTNMEGYYPALSRVLLSVIGPYREIEDVNPNSAFGILERAFYFEFKRYPQLYADAPEKATSLLPKNVRYDSAREALGHRYSSGKERWTELRNLCLEPVSLSRDAVVQSAHEERGDGHH